MNREENIDYCIDYLLRQERVEATMPPTLEEKQMLLRALMNVWQPQPLAADFVAAQDRELQAQLADKGGAVGDFEFRNLNFENEHLPLSQKQDLQKSQFTIHNSRAALWQGDITRLRVDAIVNAANSRMLGCWVPLHKCIDNAIHSAAGLQLRQECAELMSRQGHDEATGTAKITKGYNLPARYVVHTVGPIIADGVPTPEQEAELASCYRSCLDVAAANGCHSIAFCCISTGEFRFPNRRAAQIAVQTVADWQAAHTSEEMDVIFNVFKDIDYEIYHELLGAD